MANTIPLSNSQKEALIAAGVHEAVANQAFALLVSVVSDPGSPGGGTSITQAEVEAAIEASALQLGAPTTGWTYPSGGDGLIGIVAMLYNALGAGIGSTISSILGRLGTLSDAAGTISIIGLLRRLSNAAVNLDWLSASATNAIASVTIPAPGAGLRIIVDHVIASYGARPTGGTLTIGSLAAIPLTEAGPAPIPQLRLAGGTNAAVTISLSAGGAGVTGVVVVGYRTEAA